MSKTKVIDLTKIPTGWVEFGGYYSDKQFSYPDWMTPEDIQDRGSPDESNVDFVLINGVVFKFVEDPSDGYRSYLKHPEPAKRTEYSKTRFNLSEPVRLYCSCPENNAWKEDYEPDWQSDYKWDGFVFSLTEDPKTYVAYWGTDNAADAYSLVDTYFDPVKLTQAIFNNDLEDICNESTEDSEVRSQGE